MSTVELRFAALPGHVRTARMIAMAVARRAGVPAAALDEIRLAVGEACLRAVNVNRRRAPGELVDVRLTHSGKTFTVIVTDAGEPGDDAAPGPDGDLLGAPAAIGSGDAHPDGDDPASAADPGPAGAALPPGIGLALIEGLVDDLDIRRRPDGAGTIVTMTWDTATPLAEDEATAAATAPGVAQPLSWSASASPTAEGPSRSS
ncbi:MAG: ATP-binding protein [Frankia sp.]|nr:ATP-binding protein [Frankia sp.]